MPSEVMGDPNAAHLTLLLADDELTVAIVGDAPKPRNAVGAKNGHGALLIR